MRKTSIAALVLPLLVFQTPSPICGGDKKTEVPKEVRALEGTYTGAWTLYGIYYEKNELPIKRTAWTDVIKTTGAEVKDGRAYVTWVKEQSFEGAEDGVTRKVEGKAGYILTKDGTLGDYFVEESYLEFSHTTRMSRLADNVWSYAVTAPAQELSALGFPKGATGQHVMVKVTTKEQGVETHRFSRVTTVTWMDKEGKEQVTQFVSLQGFHKRQQ